MISATSVSKYKDFYNYLLLVREVRESTATYYVQKVGVLHKLTTVLSKTSIEAVYVRLKAEGRNNNYLNALRDCARVYCDFRRHNGLEVDESIYSIKKLKEVAVNRATMSDDEIESFLNLPPQCKGEKYKQNYDRYTLFYSILAYSGMRPREVATLSIDKVDFGRNVFVVTQDISKTHTQRLIPIAPNILEPLKAHVATCDKWLFPAVQGKTHRFIEPVIDNVDWGYNFHQRLKRLGIKRTGLCPYSFRHSMITRLLEQDVALFKVMKIAGHTRSQTTEAYSHLTTKDIQLAITKHPLIRKATDPRQIIDAFKEIVRSFEFEKNKRFKFAMQESNEGLSVQIKLTQ